MSFENVYVQILIWIYYQQEEHKNTNLTAKCIYSNYKTLQFGLEIVCFMTILTLSNEHFIFIISLVISLLIGFIGKSAIASFLTGIPVIGVFLTGLIGLIPNCAASVVITQLYLEGFLTAGQLMAGLLVSAGVGILVLIRTNRHQAENLRVIAALYGSGIAWGILIDLLGITFI